jgi:predicted nucleic acid-binding protein
LLILVRLKTVGIDHIRLGWKLAARYGFSHYDSLMAAAALEAGCKHLYSEDMQHGQIIENSLHIINPFFEESRS